MYDDLDYYDLAEEMMDPSQFMFWDKEDRPYHLFGLGNPNFGFDDGSSSDSEEYDGSDDSSSDDDDTDETLHKIKNLLQKRAAKPCKYYAMGHCKFGSRCRFLHEDDDKENRTEREVCKFYNTPRGCRYGAKCRYLHENDTHANTTKPFCSPHTNKTELRKTEPTPTSVHVDELKAEGNKFFEQMNYDEAVNSYSKAICVAIENLDKYKDSLHILYSNRSLAYINLKNFKEALIDACNCIDLQPTFVKGYHRRASALHHLAGYMEAKLTLDKLLQLEPNNDEAQKLQSQIFAILKKTTKGSKKKAPSASLYECEHGTFPSRSLALESSCAQCKEQALVRYRAGINGCFETSRPYHTSIGVIGKRLEIIWWDPLKPQAKRTDYGVNAYSAKSAREFIAGILFFSDSPLLEPKELALFVQEFWACIFHYRDIETAINRACIKEELFLFPRTPYKDTTNEDTGGIETISRLTNMTQDDSEDDNID